jgi:SAM-dependent methyltransferase
MACPRCARTVTGFGFDAVDADHHERLDRVIRRKSSRGCSSPHCAPHDGLVADVAAGTGKLTRMLADGGVAAIAVEPSARMCAVLRSVTRVPVIAAVAEALPFANNTLACVCVAQAFHHLHSARAIPELHRVLAPGGYLALVWNVHEATDPLKQAMDRVIDRYVDRAWPAAVFGDSRAALDSTSWFDAVESRSFEHPHRLPALDLSTLLLTSADVASRPSEVRRAFAREIDAKAKEAGLAGWTIDQRAGTLFVQTIAEYQHPQQTAEAVVKLSRALDRAGIVAKMTQS